MVLGNLGRLAGRVFAIGSDATSSALWAGFETLTSFPERLNPILEGAIEKLTPVEVTVSWVPTGPHPDDHRVVLNTRDFDQAIREGRMVRPKIKVRAPTADIDRNALADEMIENLAPLFVAYEAKVDEAKRTKARKEFLSSISAGFMAADLTVNLFFLCIIGAGALVSPLLWLLVGLGGLQALREVPSLVIAAMKNILFGTEIEQMEREVAAARLVVRKMVENMEITVDPTLRFNPA